MDNKNAQSSSSSSSSTGSVPVNHVPLSGVARPSAGQDGKDLSRLFAPSAERKNIRQTMQEAEGTALFQRELDKRLKNIKSMGNPRDYMQKVEIQVEELGNF